MLIAALLTAAAVSLCAQPLVIRVLGGRWLVDHPNERSSHVTPTPRGGGIAVVLGVLAALVFVVEVPWPAVAGIGLFALMGLIDDVLDVPALVRLAGQVILGISCGVLLTIEFLPAQLGTAHAGFGILIGLWITLFVNAFNFMDGINGISALQLVAVGVVVCLAGVVLARPVLSGWSLALVGAALGFLPFNVPRARVFLGDVGSYGLGAAAAMLLVYAVTVGVPVWVAVGVVSIYLMDVTLTILRRIRARQSLLVAHRTHVYQQLIVAGWSHLRVAGTVGGLSALIGVSALVAWRSESATLSVLSALVGAVLIPVYLWAPQLLRKAH